MKQIIRDLIVDFHATSIKIPSHRLIEFPNFPNEVRKAFVLIGMRRCGKTWSLYQHMHDLMEKGIQKKQLLYLNFEDERLIDMTVKDFQTILDVYFELYPECDGKKLFFFFDEIQEVPDWEKFVRRLLDKEEMQIYISGSSAKMLSTEIATSLRGRTLAKEIFPYSFSEYLIRAKCEMPKHLSTKQQAAMRAYVNDYLQRGGFPETFDMDQALLIETIQNYLEVVIYRDIVQRHKVTNIAALRRLLLFCLQNPGSYLSVNKMYKSLKSLGFAIGKDALYDFMHYFEDAYAFFAVPLYTLSKRQEDIHPKKIFPIDPGLITAFTLNQQMTAASRLETTVFLHLRRQHENLCYFITNDGSEIDLVPVVHGVPQGLYQASVTLKEPSTRNREIRALQAAMPQLQQTEGWIITLDEEEEIDLPEGKIWVMPLWKWLVYT